MSDTKKQKFKKIINFLKNLNPDQFNYCNDILEFNELDHCAVVSDVEGWFPKIFPNEFIWNRCRWKDGEWSDYYSYPKDESLDRYEHVIEFLEIEESHFDALFEGEFEHQTKLGLPIVDYMPSLQDVINLFEIYYNKCVINEQQGT